MYFHSRSLWNPRSTVPWCCPTNGRTKQVARFFHRERCTQNNTRTPGINQLIKQLHVEPVLFWDITHCHVTCNCALLPAILHWSSLNHRVQTGSGAHPASCPMDTVDFFLLVKRPGCETDHSSPYGAEVKEWLELYLHSPNTPSWRGT
jgi:hypothetical protein